MHTYSSINNLGGDWAAHGIALHDVTASAFNVAAAHAVTMREDHAYFAHPPLDDPSTDDGFGALIWLVRLMRQ